MEKQSTYQPPILTVNSNNAEQCNKIVKPGTDPISLIPTQTYSSSLLHHPLIPHEKHYQHNQQAEHTSYEHGAIVDNKDNLMTHDQQGQNEPLDLSTAKPSDLKYTSAKCHFTLHKKNMHSREKIEMNECEKSSAISNEFVDYAVEGHDAPRQYTPRQYAPRHYAPRQYAPRQFAPRHYATQTICHLRQYAPRQSAPRQSATCRLAATRDNIPTDNMPRDI